MQNAMIEAARRALKEVLQARPQQNLLVITDIEKRNIGEAFISAGQILNMNTETYMLPEKQRPLKDIPQSLMDKMEWVDIATTIFKGMPEETPFRVQLIRKIVKFAQRLGHAPGITENMMIHGPMNVDYQEMIIRARTLMRSFTNAREVHITSPAGTDLLLRVDGRAWETDVLIPEGRFGNLPCGEIWCAPIEISAFGVLICDGSIGDFGKVPTPLKLEVKYGKIVQWECEDATFGHKIYKALTLDDSSDVIGELGIGINPGAKITGNLLEDEKAFKTIHIAFGNNETMPGGKNRSKTHRDFLVCNPDLLVTYRDGTCKQILKGGKSTV